MELTGSTERRYDFKALSPDELKLRLTPQEGGWRCGAAGQFHVVELVDHRQQRGLAGPVRSWQVLRPSVVASRFEALRGSALSPLVGRDEEIDLLLRRWARAKAGDGQVVLVSGEPGLGKSRITAALEERLHAEPHLRLRYFCSPYHQDSALFPFIDQLGRAAGFARDDPPAAKLEKLEALLASAAPSEEDVAFLADLLSLPASARHPLPNLSPQRKKERTLEALIRQIEGLARQQPVVMVFEDAHWIDPTSRELLDLIIERVRSLPVLLIVTFRPEFQPPWTGQPQVTMLTLNRLDRRDRTALVEQIAGGKALPDEVIAQIVDRTDGVPLFVEELTKSVLESGLLRAETDRYVLDGALPPFAIPTTLHASLLARLDRLASVRLVAQTGAAIGREFSYALLHAVSRLPEDELQAALARLVGSELVFQRGTPPDAVYSFKHALVQDVAHGSLLRMPDSNCTRKSPKRSQPILPSSWTTSLSSSRSIMPRRGSSTNPSPSGARPVIGRPRSQRWRKRLRNFKRRWTSWRCCRTTSNIGDRNSNFALPSARSCSVSRDLPRRKWAMPMPARESCGNSWVLPRSSFKFPMGRRAITCTAANSMRRCAWTRICCV